MRTFQRIVITAFLLISVLSVSLAQDRVVKQSNESGIYKKGERIRVTVFLKNSETDSLFIKILKNYTEIVKEQKVKCLDDSIVLFDEDLNEPASLIFEVKTKNNTASLGAVVEPDKFLPGTKRPEDFDSYWEQEKKALRSMVMDIKSIAVENTEKGFICSDVEINCTGPKPARGYFAKPASAKPKSLPIVLLVHAAGVKGAWCLSKPQHAMQYAKKVLSVSI